MKNLKKFTNLFIIIAMLVAPFAGLTVAKAAKGNALTLPVISDPIVLAPFDATDSASSDVANQIFRGLMKTDFNLKFVPDLAAGYPTISKDGMSVTFTMKSGLKWDDGQPLTAQDVEFSYEYLMDPASAAPRGGETSEFIKSVKSTGNTVTFTLNGPRSQELIYSTFTNRYIVPKHLWEKVAKKDNMTNNPYLRNPVGCGSYKFVEWIPNERVVLEKNPLYDGKKPNIDKLIYKNVGSTANQMVQMQTGEGDVAPIAPADVAYMRTQKQVNLNQYDRFTIELITFNTVSPFFSDKRVRQAINYAVNKSAIINGLYKGLGTPANSMYFPGTFGYNSKVKTYNFDLAKAKQLLDQAGWKVGPDGIRVKDGKKFEISLITNKGNVTREKAAVIIQSQLKLVGIKVDTKVIEWNTFITKYLRPKKFELYYGGWVYSDWTQDLTPLYNGDPSKGTLNYGSYKNAALDPLMDQAVRELDPKKSEALHFKIQDIVAEDCPSIYLLYGRTTLATNKRVSGVKFARGIGINYDYSGWVLKD